MKNYFIIILISYFSNVIGQEKFIIKEVEKPDFKSKYYIVNEKGQSIKMLDTSKYLISFIGNRYESFAIFAIKGIKEQAAIDINENILFYVYNTSFGEPTPDELIENKIRIVDVNDKIGFANNKGKIIIKPQFEIATCFYKGKAIIGIDCDKIPWDEHTKEEDCHHYSIECKQHGYINEKGEIIELGDFTFEEIQNKIKWKAPEY